MATPTLKLTVVTPEAKIFEGQVKMVTLPGIEGELGILPDHIPFLTQLIPGELRYQAEAGSHSMAVGEGFVEVTGTQVNVLTDLAIGENEIEEQKVQEAIARAEEALRSKTLIGEELEATEAALSRATAQLHIKRRRGAAH